MLLFQEAVVLKFCLATLSFDSSLDPYKVFNMEYLT